MPRVPCRVSVIGLHASTLSVSIDLIGTVTWCQKSGTGKQQAFRKIKQDLSTTPILALYDPELTTTVAADASFYGLGAVLTQLQSDGTERPVAYTSRALTPAEQCYAQIEKEPWPLHGPVSNSKTISLEQHSI